MASAHFARLVQLDRFPQGAALLRFALEEPESLRILPGQYLIVNSGLMLPSGKVAKRAYSFFGTEAEGRTFKLAAERIEGGAVSSYLNSLEVGSQLQFSGPWGKFLAPASGWSRRERVVGVAVGTGITALLGLFSDQTLEAAELIWIRDPEAAFLPDSCIKDLLPQRVQSLFIGDRPPRDPIQGAAEEALKVLEPSLKEGEEQNLRIFTAGEGGAIDQLEARLLAHGIPADRIHKESFFRFPQTAS